MARGLVSLGMGGRLVARRLGGLGLTRLGRARGLLALVMVGVGVLGRVGLGGPEPVGLGPGVMGRGGGVLLGLQLGGGLRVGGGR